jgi:CRISPR/Cas system CSM-associated protein Csm2 small subunit
MSKQTQATNVATQSIEDIYNDLAKGKIEKYAWWFEKAIIAMNCTYNRGISPESVEKWRKLLENMLGDLNDKENYEAGQFSGGLAKLFAKYIKEALTSAKL